MRWLGRIVLAAVLLLAVAAGAGWLWLERALAPADPAAADAEVEFAVPRGAGVSSVARRLEAAGLIRDARAFSALARWRRVAGRIHWGDYALSPALPAREILERMVAGQVVTLEVVLPEGLTAAEMAERLAEAGVAERAALARALSDPDLPTRLGVEAPQLEGYLFPDTYRFPRGLAAEEVLATLVRRFDQAWAEVAPGAVARELDQHQVVTLASIVEKETGAAGERPLVASVFWNRLRRGMPLQSDPTVIYGIDGFDGNLRRRHLEDASNRWNTYQHGGLPPGPIANPGLAALRAVVDPAESEYLYFVSRNDGSHAFARSYAEHTRNVRQYQRGGRP